VEPRRLDPWATVEVDISVHWALITVFASPLIVLPAAEGQQLYPEPQIAEISTMRLVGFSLEMSRFNDKTSELWRTFLNRRDEVMNRSTQDSVSMQIYPNGPEQIADPAASFTKWAVVEVDSFENVPEGMDTYTLRSGTYAVFEHNGPATDQSTVMHIYTEWLPNSDKYELDNREHFEVLPPGYNALDPNAHEQFWIPIKLRD